MNSQTYYTILYIITLSLIHHDALKQVISNLFHNPQTVLIALIDLYHEGRDLFYV